jgi:hypothetical protein
MTDLANVLPGEFAGPFGSFKYLGIFYIFFKINLGFRSFAHASPLLK